MKTQFITTNGISLQVIIAGPKDGEPVFLLHGFPDFWFTWDAQIDVLVTNGFRVIVPNQRGFGESDKPTDIAAYRQLELAKDIIGIADVLGYEQFNLAGHDFGGLVAWSIVTLYPERIKKLVVISAPHLIASLKYRSIRQKLKSWYIVFFQIPYLPERMLKAFDYAMLVRNMPSFLAPELLMRYKKAWGQPQCLRAMLNWYKALIREMKLKEINYGIVTTPTHIIWGKEDSYLEAGLAQLSLDQCTTGKLTVFEETNHWVMYERSMEVSNLLLWHFTAK
ncbi:alpha/beta fold hydrolase [Aureispira anguillae]|nr:alpha/beta hydrolase [Aureispira anguillae]